MGRGGELKQLVTTNQHLFSAINGFTLRQGRTFFADYKLMMSF